MKIFVIASIVWHVIMFLCNVLSVGISIGNDQKEECTKHCVRIIINLIFLLGAVFALMYG